MKGAKRFAFVLVPFCMSGQCDLPWLHPVPVVERNGWCICIGFNRRLLGVILHVQCGAPFRKKWVVCQAMANKVYRMSKSKISATLAVSMFLKQNILVYSKTLFVSVRLLHRQQHSWYVFLFLLTDHCFRKKEWIEKKQETDAFSNVQDGIAFF